MRILLENKKGVLALKKQMKILSGFLLILLLAACSGTTETVDQQETNDENENTTETENAPAPLTLDEVFDKSTQATADLHSFAMNMDLVQEMASDLEEANMTIQSTIYMEVVSDPIAFYQKMKMDIPEVGEAIETESYFSKDGFYMQDPTSETWMKLPSEMTDQLLQLSDQQTNPGEEIKRLQSFIEDFTFDELEDGYSLTLNASGDKFNDFIQETLKETLPAELTANNEALQNIAIHSVKYDLLIDKETFLPKTIDVSMEMEMTIEGQTIKLKQDMKGDYSEHNNIEEIMIPQEVIDTAEEIAI